MFTVLLRLRQVCNDIRLTGLDRAPGGDAWTSDAASGKWEGLHEWVREVRESGGKCLIFSQFTSMLTLVKAEMEAANTPFCYLDGASRERQREVDRFQKDPAIPAFLISLKAGGYGLNLTAADHVFLLDPWWNPAVEAQAIARVHRIGQTRPVQAVRFICRGMVEEKILALQQRKRSLSVVALEDEEAPLMEGLSGEDLAQLVE